MPKLRIVSAVPEACRRQSAGATLIQLVIPRQERRKADQRREPRIRGVVDRATIAFRGRSLPVGVVNLSRSGAMLEADFTPWIGERISIDFGDGDAIEGVVRWVRQGRIGLDVGDGAIDLIESHSGRN